MPEYPREKSVDDPLQATHQKIGSDQGVSRKGAGRLLKDFQVQLVRYEIQRLDVSAANLELDGV